MRRKKSYVGCRINGTVPKGRLLYAGLCYVEQLSYVEVALTQVWFDPTDMKNSSWSFHDLFMI